jgi:glycosyltransferase involved in cell wall biosynthesis
MNREKGISIVIPVYNSSDILPELISRIEKSLRSGTSALEVILVNDFSKDKSWETICRMSLSYDWVRGIDLMRNYGQHNALLCGIRQAENDIIVTMDDDLQHPPEEIPKLLCKLEEGYDVVYGTPQKEQHGLWRDLSSQITKLALQSAMGIETARKVSAFRAFRKELREAFKDYRGPFVIIDVLLTWGTTRFGFISVQHEPRWMGVSNYTFRKLVIHALSMMTGFSTFPLQVASLIGFSFTIFGLGVLSYVILNYLIYGGSVPGFAFLASIITIFSGAQMFALGIIGEYLARMHFRMMDRPVYIVRSTTHESKYESE